MMFIARRFAHLVSVILAVTFLTFGLLELLPGDAVDSVAPLSTEEEKDVIRQELNLDDPFLVRYVQWLGDVATGDFGRSYINERSVSDILSERLSVSVLLMVYAQVIALVVSIPLAILSAWKANKPFDKIATTVSFGFISLPNYVLAIGLVYFFAVRWDIFSTIYDGETISSRLQTLFLPALSLGLPLAAVYMRLLRTDMIGTLQEDFILMAKSKGMPTSRVLLRHALRPSTFSLLTIVAIQTGALIGGALIIETLFTIPGIGGLVGRAIFQDDYPVIQAVVLVIAVFYVVFNFFVDIIYSYIDPRVRSVRDLS